MTFPHPQPPWFEEIKARPATVRAYERANEINTEPTMTEEAKKGSLRADGGGREELTGYCITASHDTRGAAHSSWFDKLTMRAKPLKTRDLILSLSKDEA